LVFVGAINFEPQEGSASIQRSLSSGKFLTTAKPSFLIRSNSSVRMTSRNSVLSCFKLKETRLTPRSQIWFLANS
jgi:hypothetical protein